MAQVVAQLKKFFGGLYKVLSFQLNLSIVSVLLLLFLGAYFVINMARKQPEVFGLLKGPSILQKEQETLIAKVGQLIALPDEEPTVATVNDKSQLSGQAFFSNAEEGDKVLIYTNATKVVLYRPSENRVVEVGTVNIQNETTEVAGVEDIEVATNRFVILNGTDIAGLTIDMETELKDALPEVEVLETANARSGYEETILVDISGQRDEEAEDLANELGLKLAGLPDGESVNSDVDFLIIVGQDRTPEEPEPESEE